MSFDDDEFGDFEGHFDEPTNGQVAPHTENGHENSTGTTMSQNGISNLDSKSQESGFAIGSNDADQRTSNGVDTSLEAVKSGGAALVDNSVDENGEFSSGLGHQESTPPPENGAGATVPPPLADSAVGDTDEVGDFDYAPTAVAAPSSEPKSSAGGDEFGEFAGFNSVPADDSTPASAPTPSGDEVDLFGDFNNADTADTTPLPVTIAPTTSGEEVDLFGDFTDAPPAETPSTAVPASNEVDLFGAFSDTPPVGDGAPPSTNAAFGVNVGSVGDPNEVRHEAPPSSVPAVEDGFSDLNTPQSAESTSAEPPVAAGEDDFGDFGEFNAVVVSSPVTAEAALAASEDEGFGNFNSVAVSGSAPAGPVSSAAGEEEGVGGFGDFNSTPTDEPIPADSNDDDFGDFSDAQNPAESSAPAVGAPSDDDFGDFSDFNDAGEFALDDAKSETNKHGSAHDNGEDDFGDFEGISNSPDEDVTKEAATGNPNSSNDFGDFEDAKEQLPASAVPTGNDDDSEFGDFGTATETAPAAPGDSNAAETTNESGFSDDFGDFNEADGEAGHPSAATTQVQQTVAPVGSAPSSFLEKSRSVFQAIFQKQMHDVVDDSSDNATEETALSLEVLLKQEQDARQALPQSNSKLSNSIYEARSGSTEEVSYTIMSVTASDKYSHFQYSRWDLDRFRKPQTRHPESSSEPQGAASLPSSQQKAPQPDQKLSPPPTQPAQKQSRLPPAERRPTPAPSVAQIPPKADKVKQPAAISTRAPAATMVQLPPNGNRKSASKPPPKQHQELPPPSGTVVQFPPTDLPARNEGPQSGTMVQLPPAAAANGNMSTVKRFLEQVPDLSFMLSPTLKLPQR